MGMTVGPALSSALERKFGAANFMSQGVSYPASIEGAVSGAINPSGAPGSKDMTKKVKAIWASCPDTKIILSGYSQGAEQVHGTLQKDNLGPDGAKIAVSYNYFFWSMHQDNIKLMLIMVCLTGSNHLWRSYGR
jgi:cutinase